MADRRAEISVTRDDIWAAAGQTREDVFSWFHEHGYDPKQVCPEIIVHEDGSVTGEVYKGSRRTRHAFTIRPQRPFPIGLAG